MLRISEEHIEGGRVKITSKCSECGKEFTIAVSESALHDYKFTNNLIQNIFPELTASERELHFQSGICGICWDEMFSDSDEDDEDEE